MQADTYSVKTGDGTLVEVSNFVTPYYFTEDPLGQPLDHLGNLKQTFDIAKGGYQIRMKAGTVSNVFGDDFSKQRSRRQGSESRTHVLAQRDDGARTVRRLKSPVPTRTTHLPRICKVKNAS